MAHKPFHHGNLREELLERARATLRREGEDAVSLRQLAREAGVSHGAPNRHFPDRRRLLDALAERGFDELTAAVAEGAERAGGDAPATFRAVARAYIDFATRDGALMDLMFRAKEDGSASQVAAAADAFFATVGDVMRRTVSPPRGADPTRRQLLLASTLHGMASLLAAGRLAPTQVDELVDEMGLLFDVHGAAPNRV